MSLGDGLMVWLGLTAKAFFGALVSSLLALCLVPELESWWAWATVAAAALVGMWLMVRYCDDFWGWLRENLTRNVSPC